MQFISVVENYKVYKNADGFLELYKTIGQKDDSKQHTGSDLKRIVTRFTTLTQVEKWLKKQVKLKPKPDSSKTLFE